MPFVDAKVIATLESRDGDEGWKMELEEARAVGGVLDTSDGKLYIVVACDQNRKKPCLGEISKNTAK